MARNPSQFRGLRLPDGFCLISWCGRWGFSPNTYTYPAAWKTQPCDIDVQINSVLNRTNGGRMNETACDSFWAAPAGFFSLASSRERLLRCTMDSNDEDPLSQEVSFGRGVLCEASLLCSGHVMQTAISKAEIPPDKLITSHVFFRKNNPGLLRPPQLALTKGHLVSVKDLFEKYWTHREQGQCFSKTKSLMVWVHFKIWRTKGAVTKRLLLHSVFEWVHSGVTFCVLWKRQFQWQKQ